MTFVSYNATETPNRLHLRDAALLALLTAIVLGRLCASEFVGWDDPMTIATNAAFNPPNARLIAQYWIKPELSLYIPLTYTTWGLLATIAQVEQPDETGSRLNPWVFHTANVVIHIVSVILVWKVLLSLIKDRRAAWFAAALFAIHPVQVETVAWASGTKDLLCGMFVFAAILGLIRHRVTSRKSDLILSTIAVLLACLSKPTGIVAPIVAIIVDVMLLHTPLRRSVATLWSWFGIAAIFAIIGKIVQPPVMAYVPPIWVRPLIATDALAFYLWKLIWPFDLAIDYGRSPTRAIAQGWIAFTWIAPAIVTCALIAAWRWKYGRQFTAAALLMLAGLSPVLGFMPFTFQAFSSISDHYLYIPMLGVSFAFAVLLMNLDSRWATALAAIIIALLSVRAFSAAADWRTNTALWAHTLDVNPRSAMAHTNWAIALAQHGDEPSAIAHLRQAIDVDRDYVFAHFNLAGLLLKHGQNDEATGEYREVLRIYQTQRNYDPALADNVQKVIEKIARHTSGPATEPQ